LYEFLWFIGGAFVYRFLSAVFSLTQASRVFDSLSAEVLTYLGTVVEDIAFIKTLRYKTMLESGLDPEDVKVATLRDEEYFEEWKSNCAVRIHRSVPNYVRLPFQYWEDAMSLLNDMYRRPDDETKKE